MPEIDVDTFALVESIIAKNDPLAAVTALDEMMRDQYWKQKNLFLAIALGRSAAQHALRSAAQTQSPQTELAAQLRNKTFAILYNIASFSWSGWGEEGITVTKSDEKIGYDAARANLRMTVELKQGEIQVCRAHWMVGAHQISAGDYVAAIASFNASERHAKAAGERGEELLAVAFARLAQHLSRRSDESRAQLTASIEELRKVKDGDFFSGQVTKAMEVFSA